MSSRSPIIWRQKVEGGRQKEKTVPASAESHPVGRAKTGWPDSCFGRDNGIELAEYMSFTSFFRAVSRGD
jgi:hypothetical protein